MNGIGVSVLSSHGLCFVCGKSAELFASSASTLPGKWEYPRQSIHLFTFPSESRKNWLLLLLLKPNVSETLRECTREKWFLCVWKVLCHSNIVNFTAIAHFWQTTEFICFRDFILAWVFVFCDNFSTLRLKTAIRRLLDSSANIVCVYILWQQPWLLKELKNLALLVSTTRSQVSFGFKLLIFFTMTRHELIFFFLLNQWISRTMSKPKKLKSPSLLRARRWAEMETLKVSHQ